MHLHRHHGSLHLGSEPSLTPGHPSPLCLSVSSLEPLLDTLAGLVELPFLLTGSRVSLCPPGGPATAPERPMSPHARLVCAQQSPPPNLASGAFPQVPAVPTLGGAHTAGAPQPVPAGRPPVSHRGTPRDAGTLCGQVLPDGTPPRDSESSGTPPLLSRIPALRLLPAQDELGTRGISLAGHPQKRGRRPG